MASCGRKLIIRMCHPQCMSISSALWLLQSDKVGTGMCVHTGVRVAAIMCICVCKYNYKFDVLSIRVTKKWGDGIWFVLVTICASLCAQRVTVCIFYECVCMFVYVVPEERLSCGQNNLTSRCAEA